QVTISQPAKISHRSGDPSAPLDLSIRRSSDTSDLVVDLGPEYDVEEEKENRRSVDNKSNICHTFGSSPEGEEIVCAPSIPLMLSTSSTSSSPSPCPVSPTLSSSSVSNSKRICCDVPSKRFRTESGSNSPSPKPQPISSPRSPRKTPNGVVINLSSNSNSNSQSKFSNGLKHTEAGSANQKKAFTAAINHIAAQESGANLSNLLIAAMNASGQREDTNGLGSSHLKTSLAQAYHTSVINMKHNGKSSTTPSPSLPAVSKPFPPIPSVISNAAGSLPLLPLGGPGNPALLASPSILPFLTSEIAMRVATELPNLMQPQVLVKQGVSKCRECNIVFCKHENYIAHKKHYCSARLDSGSGGDDASLGGPGANTPSPLAMSNSPTAGNSNASAGSPTSGKECRSVSPGPAAPAAQKPTLFQFICAACGIKFTSFDNLTAHQSYYCPKRSELTTSKPEVASEKVGRKCSKCKMMIPADQVVTHQCAAPVGASNSSGSGGAGWKCPCCEVVSPTASAAQRHMETHSKVKAFRCTICRYKGNTLRGMRTHIRMHFEKRAADLQEENYITCILSDETDSTTSVTIPPQSKTEGSGNAGEIPPNESPANEGSRVEKLHFCDLCNYSSTYKGNVVRHYKLVHNKTSNNIPDDCSFSSSSSVDAKSIIGDGEVRSQLTNLGHSVNNVGDEDESLKADQTVDISVKQEREIDDSEVIEDYSEGDKISEIKNEPRSLSDVEDAHVADKSSKGESKSGDTEDTDPLELSGNKVKPPGPKYCKSCDISFQYLSTFVAHKKFYCSSHAGENNGNRTAEASAL
ncbi:Zinc finger protein ush, partial [Gryllus bimaculatus]